MFLQALFKKSFYSLCRTKPQEPRGFFQTLVISDQSEDWENMRSGGRRNWKQKSTSTSSRKKLGHGLEGTGRSVKETERTRGWPGHPVFQGLRNRPGLCCFGQNGVRETALRPLPQTSAGLQCHRDQAWLIHPSSLEPPTAVLRAYF